MTPAWRPEAREKLVNSKNSVTRKIFELSDEDQRKYVGRQSQEQTEQVMYLDLPQIV